MTFIPTLTGDNEDDFRRFVAVTFAISDQSHFLEYQGSRAWPTVEGFSQEKTFYCADVLDPMQFPSSMQAHFQRPASKRTGYLVHQKETSIRCKLAVASVIKNRMDALDASFCALVLGDSSLFAAYDFGEDTLFSKAYATLTLKGTFFEAPEALRLFSLSGRCADIYMGRDEPLTTATRFFSPIQLALDPTATLPKLGSFTPIKVDGGLALHDDFIFV